MDKNWMRLFRITRNGATAYVSHYSSGLPIIFTMPDPHTREDRDLLWDLEKASMNIPGGDLHFYEGCSNVIMYNEEQARKFVDWLKGYWGKDTFEAEYICPYTNEEAWESCPSDMHL